MLPTELEAVLIRRSLVRVQIGEPKNIKARKRKFAGFFFLVLRRLRKLTP
jgi:hypothetical protein